MNTEHILLPPEWNALCHNIALQHGISMDTAALLFLQAYGVACGDTIKLRTPDRVDLSPAFQLALVSNGIAFPRGALATLIAPLRDDADQTCAFRDSKGLAFLKHEWELHFKTRPDILKAIEETKAKVMEAQRPDQFERRFKAHAYSIGAMDQEIERWEREIRDELEKCAKNDEFFEQIHYILHPDIILDEPHWRDLQAWSNQSFDSSALAMCFANGPLELLSMSPQERKNTAEALRSTQHGAPGITIITCEDETAYGEILSQRALRKSGILNGFLFVDIGDGVQTDPTVFADPSELDRFHAMLMKRFKERVKGGKTARCVRLIDERGLGAYIDLKKWLMREQQECAPQVAPFLSVLPDLALRLALTRAAMEGIPEGYFIKGEFVERSVEFIKVLGRRQRILLERLAMAQTDDEALESKIEKVIRKLEVRGPLTKRAIARTFHHQDYGHLEALLDAGISRGRIQKRGDFYHAPNVSVSASAQC